MTRKISLKSGWYIKSAWLMVLLCYFFGLGIVFAKPKFPARKLPVKMFEDKLWGGITGQLLAIVWADATRKTFNKPLFPDNPLPVLEYWRINEALENADMSVFWPIAEAVSKNGANGKANELLDIMNIRELWVGKSAQNVRFLKRQGIEFPFTGNAPFNSHCEDISWPRQAVYLGVVCPGRPMDAAGLAFRYGQTMACADGQAAGMLVAAMVAESYVSQNPFTLLENSLKVLDGENLVRKMGEELVAQAQEKDASWLKAWKKLTAAQGLPITETSLSSLPSGRNEARLFAGMVMLSILYGNGNLVQSIGQALKCGFQAQYYAQTTGLIVGNMVGQKKITSVQGELLDKNAVISQTPYTLLGWQKLCNENTEKLLKMTRVKQQSGPLGPEWNIPKSRILPFMTGTFNNVFQDSTLRTEIKISGSGLKVKLKAQIPKGYQACWSVGDLKFSNSHKAKHKYSTDGSYMVYCNFLNYSGQSSALTFEYSTLRAGQDRTVGNSLFSSPHHRQNIILPGSAKFKGQSFNDSNTIIFYDGLNILGSAPSGKDFGLFSGLTAGRHFLTMKVLGVPETEQNNRSKIIQVPFCAYKLDFEPKIDGEGDEYVWQKAIDIPIQNRVGTAFLNDDLNISDFKGNCHLTWSDSSLFVLVKIKDNFVGIENVDIFISNLQAGKILPDTQIFKFGFRYPDTTVYINNKPVNNKGKLKGNFPSFKWKANKEGYCLEAQLKWSFLKINPVPEQLLGFNLMVTDNDNSLKAIEAARKWDEFESLSFNRPSQTKPKTIPERRYSISIANNLPEPDNAELGILWLNGKKE